ncbi:MAG: SDR family NAD(P)-dependent oxidoreductase [Actinomycetota bacterium]|nr:SDR family NAD(P)-dependent oxidoreductase [Actinomycetota bacterium]
MTAATEATDDAAPPAGHRPSTALVTGAARGIGLEWVRQLRADGVTVIAGVRTTSDQSALEDLGAGPGGELMIVELDVTDEAAVHRARVDAVELIDHLDLVVNNAGTGAGRPATPASKGPVEALDPAAMGTVIATNAIGPVLVAKHFVDLVARSARGVIVNTTTVLGSLALASRRDARIITNYAYRAAYAAQNIMTLQLAQELEPRGVIVVGLGTGHTRSRMGDRDAAQSTTESVTAQRRVVSTLTAADSGRVMSHLGTDVEW